MNIWDFDGWKIITTNGVIKYNGEAVMGAGLAKQAKDKYPLLPLKLAAKIQKYGNTLFIFPEYKIITFPTKHHWKNDSDIALIEKSTQQLHQLLSGFPDTCDKVAMPKVGCRNGNLDWNDVKKVLDFYLTEFVQSGKIVYIE